MARGERTVAAMNDAAYTAALTKDQWCVPSHYVNSEGNMIEVLVCSTSARQAASFAPTMTAVYLTYAMSKSM
jgi:hypothetical protein